MEVSKPLIIDANKVTISASNNMDTDEKLEEERIEMSDALAKQCHCKIRTEQYLNRHLNSRNFLILAGLNIALITVCIAALVYMTLHLSGSDPVTSDVNIFNDLVSTDSVASVIQRHIFCLSCESVKDAEKRIFDSVDGKRCCIKNILDLIRFLKYTFVKSMNQHSSDVAALRSNLGELKEDINNVESVLYSLDRSNLTDELHTHRPADNLIRAKVEKNNRLINSLLNHRRSVLHLSGTAGGSRIAWEEEVKEGNLSFDADGILVHGGGKYLLFCNIHFTKKVCDGNENFEYRISQEYSPGEFFPVARAQKTCVNGSSIDTGLFVESVISVELGQSRALKIQYDSKSHEFISKRYKLHTMGVIEI